MAAIPPTDSLPPELSPRAAPPWSVGLRAAHANLVPGFCLQAGMLAIVYAYYRIPAARPWFDRLSALKQHGGYFFSAAAAAFAGAVLPDLFNSVFLQRRLTVRQRLDEFAFAVVFWGISGLLIDLLYRCQTFWFGASTTLTVITTKVVVDQFIYNPLIAAPYAAWAYELKNRRYFIRGMGETFTGRFYKDRVLPTLIATWGVWIPVVTVIYSLPPLLQIPLFSIALSFWALLLAYIQSERPTAPKG